jgi:hypothetical protein
MTFTIDHDRRMVDVVGSGEIVLKDVTVYFDALVTEGGMPYRKLIDLRGITPNFSDNDVMMLGARVSAYANMEPRGPIAVVSNADATDLFIRRFMNLGGAKRPIRLFASMDEATQWLQVQPDSQPGR